MIGDGMGPNQVRLAADYAGKPLTMTSLPVQGALKTFSANNAVTDSAAAGTALACGRKTNNGVIGQLPDGTALASIAERARDVGKRVGLLTTVPVNHATPAAFYAKAGSRNSYYDIGLQAVASRFDVLGGKTLSDADGGNAKPRPEKSLWDVFREAGRKHVKTPGDLRAATLEQGPLLIVPENLHTEAAAPYAVAIDPATDITLAQMVSKSLELLDNPHGFFLMVEGGAIDWAGHANDAAANIAETLSFDEAVAVAKAFADAHPGTVLVVTADHETGGLSFADGYSAEKARAVLSAQKAKRGNVGDWLRTHLAASAGADDVGWAAARAHLADALGVPESSFAAEAEKAYASLAKASEKDRGKAADKFLREVFKVRDAAAGLAWSTGGHTAKNVPVYALGSGTERFAGTQDNTRVPAHGVALLGLPPL